MLEGIFRVGWYPALKDQLRGHQLCERIIELLLRHLRDGTDQLVRKLTSQTGSDLCDLPHRREAAEPRHERHVERRRDGQRLQRQRYSVMVTLVRDRAAFKHGF